MYVQILNRLIGYVRERERRIVSERRAHGEPRAGAPGAPAAAAGRPREAAQTSRVATVPRGPSLGLCPVGPPRRAAGRRPPRLHMQTCVRHDSVHATRVPSYARKYATLDSRATSVGHRFSTRLYHLIISVATF